MHQLLTRLWSMKKSNILLLPQSKIHHKILGNGIVCKKQLIIYYYTMDFWKYKSVSFAVLTNSECRNLINDKRCENVEMTCDDEKCFGEQITEYLDIDVGFIINR